MKRKLAIFGVFGLLLIGLSAWFVNKYFGIEARSAIAHIWPPPTTREVEARQLRRISGWFSVDCGHVPRHTDADPAIKCAMNALRSHERFRVSFDYMGLDSHGVTGLAANSAGEVYEITTDELGVGWGGAIATADRLRSVTVTRCDRAPVEETSYPANRLLSCTAAADNSQ